MNFWPRTQSHGLSFHRCHVHVRTEAKSLRARPKYACRSLTEDRFFPVLVCARWAFREIAAEPCRLKTLRLGPLECLLQKKETFKLPYRGNASTVRHGLKLYGPLQTWPFLLPTLPLLWVCGFVLVPYLGPLTHTDRHTDNGFAGSIL